MNGSEVDVLEELAALRRSFEEMREKVRPFIAREDEPTLEEFGNRSFNSLTKLIRITLKAEENIGELRGGEH